MCDQSLIETPARAIPSEPLSQARDITQCVLMLVDEAERQCIVTKSRRSDFLLLVAVLAERNNFRCRGFYVPNPYDYSLAAAHVFGLRHNLLLLVASFDS